jgi:hypothetical protein
MSVERLAFSVEKKRCQATHTDIQNLFTTRYPLPTHFIRPEGE